MNTVTDKIDSFLDREYSAGFVTSIESDTIPKGLSEDTIRLLSAKKGEPEFMLEWRLAAYRHWLTMSLPEWAQVSFPRIDFQDISYYSAPKQKEGLKSMDEVDPELLRTFEKLGVPLHERARLAGVAVDAVFDSVSVATTYKASSWPKSASFSARSPKPCRTIRIWCASISARWCRTSDNFYAALNSAVFSRRLVLLHPQRRALPDGTVHLLPHQRARHRASSSAP